MINCFSGLEMFHPNGSVQTKQTCLYAQRQAPIAFVDWCYQNNIDRNRCFVNWYKISTNVSLLLFNYLKNATNIWRDLQIIQIGSRSKRILFSWFFSESPISASVSRTSYPIWWRLCLKCRCDRIKIIYFFPKTVFARSQFPRRFDRSRISDNLASYFFIWSLNLIPSNCIVFLETRRLRMFRS